MKLYQWLSIVLAAGLQLGCSEAARKQDAAAGAQAEMALPAPPQAIEVDAAASGAAPAAEATPPAAEATPPLASPLPSPAAAPATRLLIYHADVRLKTEAMPRAAAGLDSLVRRSGGFVTAATETHADGEWRQETTIRVPPTRFQALLRGLRGLGTIEERKLSTDDVTAEHADVAARLLAKRAVEHQYTVLLGRAQKIQDMLDVQQKLGEVREEIEATESRLKTLNDQVAYSTITLTLYQPLTLAVPDAPVVSFFSRLTESLFDGWELLVGLVLGVVAVWPLLLLGAAGIWLWLRRRARRQRLVAIPVDKTA